MVHIQEVKNDIYIAQNDICMATQGGTCMNAKGNNDMKIGVKEDIVPEQHAKVMGNNNEGVEVIRMVHECFKRYDGLTGCTNTAPNEVGMEEELHGPHADLDELANIQTHGCDEDNDEYTDNTED